jgi:hypothetical protein
LKYVCRRNVQDIKDLLCGFAVFTAGLHNKHLLHPHKSEGFHPNHKGVTNARQK